MKRACLAGTIGMVCLLTASAAQFARGEEPANSAETRPKYIRLARGDSDELRALQTAIVRFKSADAAKGDLAVDLVGAVHVGEKAYYEALNKRFQNYDVVLYELVAPDGTRVPKGGRASAHPVAILQNGLKDLLGLEHQLEHVDYTRQNMVHADMSPDDFARSMEERGESFMGMFFRMMGQAMAQQSLGKNRTSDFDLLAAFFDRDRAGALKRVMAEQFENADGMMQALDGPDGSTIITERNKVALAKLADQIAAGKKKIAVFYGAGHLGDMEKRLLADFQLRRASEEWLDAWNLEKAPRARKPKRPAQKKAASILPLGAPGALWGHAAAHVQSPG
ncbi:MAG: hypothetical protein WD063_18675 [Pirellulales bacterium]